MNDTKNIKDTFRFLKTLAANNDREWFNAHKEEYLAVKKYIEDLTERLLAALCEIEPEASRLSPSDCLYRIYRDTRFSADKTPYKTHIGIFINPPAGKKSERCGYYFHIEPGNCLVAGGAWCPPAPLLKEYRRSIYDNVEEYLEIINDPAFKDKIAIVGEDLLKTVPKDFPKDWEHIDLLKPRSFVVYAPVSDREILSGDVVDTAFSRFRVIKPYNDFLNYTFEEHPELLYCRKPR